MRVILIGGHKTAYFLGRQFVSKGYHLTIINQSPVEAKWLAEQIKGTIILGDGSDPAMLEEAGARRADVVIALTPYDQDNLVACQLAQKLYGVPRTIAVVNDPDNEEIFTRLGISTAFSATRILASLIEQQTGFEDIKNLIPVADGRVTVVEVTLHRDAPAVGKNLEELNLPADSLVACIVRGDAVLVPRGHSYLQVADRLIVISLPASQGQTLRTLVGQAA